MKKRSGIILLAAFVLSNTFILRAQNIDSLKMLMKSASHDTTRLKLLVELSEVCEISDILIYAEPARELAEANLKKNTKGSHLYSFYNKKLGDACINIGYFYQQKGEVAKTLEYYYRAKDIFEQLHDIKALGFAINNIGYAYQNQGNIPKALEFALSSVEIFEKLNDKRGMGVTLNNIAMLYDKQDDVSNAMAYYKKSLVARREANDRSGTSGTLNNLGTLYKDLKDYEKASECFAEALKINEELNDKAGLSITYNNIGTIFHSKNDLTKALEYYEKSRIACHELNDLTCECTALNNITGVYHDKKEYKKAEPYGVAGLKLAREIGFPSVIANAAYTLKRVYQSANKYREALEMYDLYIQYRDSVANEKNRNLSVRTQFQYEYDKKEAEIKANAKAEKEIIEARSEEERNKQRIIIFAVSLGLILMGIIAFVIFRSLQQNKEAKRIIEYQKELVEESKQEILDSITYAKRIQSAILPPMKLVKEFLKESFVIYLPKDIVAGDFYWMEHVGDTILFAAADCTGHGVPGAMVSVVCNNGLNRSVREYGIADPGKILDKTREIIIKEFEKSEEDVKDGMDISLCALNIKSGQLKWAGANNPIIIVRCTGELEQIKANKQPIGKYTDPKPFTTHLIQLNKGDSVYIFTDGFQDQFGGEEGKKFKAAKMKQLLQNINAESMDKKRELILAAFKNWKGTLEQVDDVCIIGFSI